jgi:hypothetical protein
MIVMLLSRTRWLMVVSVACGLSLSGPARSQQTAEPTADERSAEVVESLALAAELTAFGRGEFADATGLKDFKSAESLVAAGGILLRIHKQTGGKAAPGDATVSDEQGKEVAEISGDVQSLADEAAALFDEARALPVKDQAALEALIKQAQTVTARAGGVGVRVVTRTIGPGHAHTIRLAPKPNTVIAVQGAGRTHFQAIGPGGNVVWHSHGPRGVYNGPGKDVTLKVINKDGPVAKYKVFAN